MGLILNVGTELAGYTLAREHRKLDLQLPLKLISSAAFRYADHACRSHPCQAAYRLSDQSDLATNAGFVKTPACPVVVAPPPAGCNGVWSTETLDDGGTVARFTRPDGNLAGFALTGIWTVEKQVPSKQLPPLLA